LMGLYDNRRSNISKQSAQSKALKRQKAAERRERRQTELRYTIQATPEAVDAPGAEEEMDDDDAGLGGLFDDSPDSEAESEPGSPHIMSAAWVERTARDPVLQHLISRGLQELGEPAFDIASHLERMDLAQRQQIISDIAVGEQQVARRDALRAERAEVERETAEVDRRLAELHVTNHTAGG
jgi:hypothetical protein